jgi:hypothetical protein
VGSVMCIGDSLSVHQWIRSAIRDSYLVRYYWHYFLYTSYYCGLAIGIVAIHDLSLLAIIKG